MQPSSATRSSWSRLQGERPLGELDGGGGGLALYDRQAAGLVVVTGQDAASHERVFDVRVDDHPEDDVLAVGVFAHAPNGDVERAAALVAEIVAVEPLWRASFERYEELELLPEGIVPASG